MMSLLRTALWASVALALLPSFVPRQDSTLPADAAASDAVNAASATFADMRRLCERRPDACAAGLQFANAFGHRAQAGAKILYDLVGEKVGKTDHVAAGSVTHAGSAGNGTAEAAASEAAKPSQHTLTATDMAPAWRGPQPRRDTSARRTS